MEAMHDSVDERTVWFHDIVGQRKCVVTIAVEYAERWKQSRTH